MKNLKGNCKFILIKLVFRFFRWSKKKPEQISAPAMGKEIGNLLLDSKIYAALDKGR